MLTDYLLFSFFAGFKLQPDNKAGLNGFGAGTILWIWGMVLIKKKVALCHSLGRNVRLKCQPCLLI